MLKKNRWVGIFTLGLIFWSSLSHAGKDRDGGFEFENSREILQRASSELAGAIESADSAIFPEFAPGWNQTSFAKLIREVQHLPNRTTVGTNPYDSRERRVFDYEEVYDNEGIAIPGRGSIAALYPYFEQYKHIPVFTSESSVVDESIREVKRRLIHEASHLVWGYNETRAKQISVELLEVLAPLSDDHERLPITVEVAGARDEYLGLTGYELKKAPEAVEGNPLAKRRADRVCQYYGFEKAVDYLLGWYEHSKQVKYVDDAGNLKVLIAKPYWDYVYYRYPAFARKPVRISKAQYDPRDPTHRRKVTKVWKLGKFSAITCLRNPQN